jgi:hypothetical protein
VAFVECGAGLLSGLLVHSIYLIHFIVLYRTRPIGVGIACKEGSKRQRGHNFVGKKGLLVCTSSLCVLALHYVKLLSVHTLVLCTYACVGHNTIWSFYGPSPRVPFFSLPVGECSIDAPLRNTAI